MTIESVPELMTRIRPPTNGQRVAAECVCCGGQMLKKSPAILMPFVAERVFGWEPVQVDESWGLLTIKPGTAYTVCNSTLCTDCGLLFLDMRFSDDELAALYHGYRDEHYTHLREKYEPGYRQRNEALLSGPGYVSRVEEFLERLIPRSPRILDWGGDKGQNSPFRGINGLLHVYDISATPTAPWAKAIDKQTALRTEYDLIVCSNVLEHIPYPAGMLLEMRQAMRRHTLLYVEVPLEDLMRNAGGASDLHTRKKHWHEHINFFSEQSLKRLLHGCGFRLLQLRQIAVPVAGKTVHLLQFACTLAS